MMTRDCAKVHEIWREEMRHVGPSQEARSFVSKHLDACPACRLEAKALAAAAVGDDASPAPVLDDIAKRRWIERVMARHRTARDEPSRPAAFDSRPRRTDARWITAAAAAAAAIAVIVIMTSRFERHTDDREASMRRVEQREKRSDEATVRILPVEVLLTAGGEGAGDPSVGERLSVGDGVRTGDGIAILDLSGQGRVLLRAQTELMVDALDETRIELALRAGSVVATWDPTRESSHLVIAERRGRVVVKGTVFSVDATRSRVNVLRGEIDLEEPNGLSRTVHRGEGVDFDSWGVSELRRDEIDQISTELHAIRLLGSETSAGLRIDSEPSKAFVYVDGVALGRAPLEARVPAGILELWAFEIGHEPVVETISARAGERVFRRYVFQARRGESAETIARADAAVPTPEELLHRAQEHRLRREWSLAADSLEELILRYPERAEASSSLVSLGLIQLEHLARPIDALREFDRYLSASHVGSLAQEAAWGRIRALRTLGRRDEEGAAIAEFLARFPNAIQAQGARERQRELGDQ
jgi:hypothetical protein